MLRPVTSFGMRRSIPSFRKSKKTPSSLNFQDRGDKNMGKFQVKQEGVQRRNANFQNEFGKLHLLT
jgi:hypothetical protein